MVRRIGRFNSCEDRWGSLNSNQHSFHLGKPSGMVVYCMGTSTPKHNSPTTPCPSRSSGSRIVVRQSRSSYTRFQGQMGFMRLFDPQNILWFALSVTLKNAEFVIRRSWPVRSLSPEAAKPHSQHLRANTLMIRVVREIEIFARYYVSHFVQVV